MHEVSTLRLVGIAVILSLAAGGLLIVSELASRERLNAVDSFEKCSAAGFAVMESYPERCALPDGRVFTRDILVVRDPQPNDCVIGGCSSELCGERSESEQLVSNCEYRAAYACYNRFSACERQPDGQCGWTPTEGLSRCIRDADSTDAGTVY